MKLRGLNKLSEAPREDVVDLEPEPKPIEFPACALCLLSLC